MRPAMREPKYPLEPSAFSIESAQRWALLRSRKLPRRLFKLKACWYINFVRQHVLGDRTTRYAMKLAQTEEYGISVATNPVLADPQIDLVGKDTRQILRRKLYQDHAERIALVDSIMANVSRPADQRILLSQPVSRKYEMRSLIFAREARRVLRRKGLKGYNGEKPSVLVIGATAGIIAALAKKGFHVSATDLWPEAVHKELGGVKVLSGKEANARLMKEADLAIITGMTLANRTLPQLMRLAKRHNTATMIWAITGRNFGHYYTDHGVDSVVSDPAPFLLLPGAATISIWRRRK